MLTKQPPAAAFATLLGAALAIGCQPQRVDRAVRDNIDVKRTDAGAARGGSGGSAADAPSAGSGSEPTPEPPNPDAGAAAGARGGGPGSGTGGQGGGADAAEPGAPGRSDAAGDARIDTRPENPVADAAPESARDDSGGDGAPGADDLVTHLLAMTPQICATKVAGDFTLDDPGVMPGGTAAICGLKGAYYWVADLNIDCDGRDAAGAAAKCPVGHATDTFTHNGSNQPLAASVTPYVVVPASAANADLPAVDLKPGTIIAVINHQTRQIVFAVFGDTETNNRIGAASYACAEQLGIDPNPMTGGQKGNTVTYVAFTDPTAVPRNIENQTETRQLGEMLAAKIIADNK